MAKKKEPTEVAWDEYGTNIKIGGTVIVSIFDVNVGRSLIAGQRLGDFLVAAINEAGYDNIIKGRVKK